MANDHNHSVKLVSLLTSLLCGLEHYCQTKPKKIFIYNQTVDVWWIHYFNHSQCSNNSYFIQRNCSNKSTSSVLGLPQLRPQHFSRKSGCSTRYTGIHVFTLVVMAEPNANLCHIKPSNSDKFTLPFRHGWKRNGSRKTRPDMRLLTFSSTLRETKVHFYRKLENPFRITNNSVLRASDATQEQSVPFLHIFHFSDGEVVSRAGFLRTQTIQQVEPLAFRHLPASVCCRKCPQSHSALPEWQLFWWDGFGFSKSFVCRIAHTWSQFESISVDETD